MACFELKSDVTVKEGSTGNQQEEEDQQKRSRRTWLLGLVFFLYFSGMHMSTFVIVQYIYRRIQVDAYPNETFKTGQSYCTLNHSDPTTNQMTKVQEKAASYSVAFGVISGIPSIVINILLGSYTDKYGRKFLMILSMTGSLIRAIVSLVGVYTNMNIGLFALGFAFEGLTGQPFSMLLAGYSYVSDVTTRKERPIGIVLLEVCIGLGTTFPTFAVGYFLESSGFKSPLIASVCISAVTIMLCLLVLPESLPPSKRVKQEERCVNLKNAIGFYVSPSNAGKRWKYILCILVFCFTMIDLLGRNSVETLYQMNAPFCWTPKRLGWFGALRTGLQQVFGMLSVKIFKIFLEDDSIAMLGCVSYAAAFLLEAFAKTDVMIYIVTAVGAFGLLTIPMIRSIMSKMTSPDKQAIQAKGSGHKFSQLSNDHPPLLKASAEENEMVVESWKGAVAASISTAETVCQLAAHAMMGSIYKGTVKNFAGTVFIVMACLNGLGFICLLILKIGSRGTSYDDYGKFDEKLQPISYKEID